MNHDSSNFSNNVNVKRIDRMVTPAELMKEIPTTPDATQNVVKCRESIKKILSGSDQRLLVVCGPCSIHSTSECITYAQRLKALADLHSDHLLIVMRTYFEKPRTIVGWKGLINDPHLDGSCDVNAGLQMARKFLLEVNSMGLPVGVEFLDTITPQYYADLVSWGAIGARTTESQLHRQLASGLSMPIGFKNGTSGQIQVAVDAVKSAEHEHVFPGITEEGNVAIVSTSGNPHCHLILRGGKDTGPQYSSEWIETTAQCMRKGDIHRPNIVVDCSHGNSQKIHSNQSLVARDVANQIRDGERRIVGVMLESHIHEGCQKIRSDGSTLEYGKSVTDACIDLETTEQILRELSEAVASRDSQPR